MLYKYVKGISKVLSIADMFSDFKQTDLFKKNNFTKD